MANQPGSGKWMRIGLHALAAGVFVFILQRFALHQSLEVSALWGLGFAVAAAHLAWLQSQRQ